MDFINSEFFYRKNVLANNTLSVNQAKYIFRTKKTPNNLKVLLYGMSQPLAVHFIATILSNKNNINFEKNGTLLKSNYYGSLSQCKMINIGCTENGTEVYNSLKNIIPMFDPNNITFSGWDNSEFSFSKLENKSLEEKLESLSGEKIVPMKIKSFNEIRAQIEDFKKDDFVFVINCTGESTDSNLETIKEKIAKKEATEYEMVLLASFIENCHVLNFVCPFEKEFRQKGLHYLVSKVNTFVYNFNNDALRTEASSEYYETESNRILYDSSPKIIETQPGILQTILSGNMNTNILITKQVVIENKFYFLISNIIDILVFSEFFSRVEYIIETQNKIQEFKKFDPMLCSLNYFIENQTILNGYKMKITSSTSLINTILVIAGLEPITDLYFENI